MIRTMIGGTSLLMLAACGGGVEMKNASVEEVSAAAKDAARLDPGNWKTTVEIVSVDIPGIGAENKAMADAMSKGMMGRKNVTEHCVTKEMADKPPADMLGGSGDCRFDTFKLAGGSLDAKMVCKSGPQPGSMTMLVNGSYGGSAYTLNSEMTMEGGPGAHAGGKMVIKAKTSGERTGECKAGAAAKS
jgi:Protein of unknown function (DUF3617)